MKFFIDTAEFDEIKEAYDLGFIDGVTTNPSLKNRDPPSRRALHSVGSAAAVDRHDRRRS